LIEGSWFIEGYTNYLGVKELNDLMNELSSVANTLSTEYSML